MSIDLHQLPVILFAIAIVFSVLFFLSGALAKEFERVALVWIRVFKRLRTEWRKPAKLEIPAKQHQLVDQTDSRRELD